MRKSLVLFAVIGLAGCSGPKPEIAPSEVAGTYKMYVEPSLGETDQVSLVVMRSAEFVSLTIKDDGTYKVILDNKARPNNGDMLDEGTYKIEGKNVVFDTKHPASPTERKELCFTNLGHAKIEPSGPGKYRYTFTNGDRIIMFKQ